MAPPILSLHPLGRAAVLVWVPTLLVAATVHLVPSLRHTTAGWLAARLNGSANPRPTLLGAAAIAVQNLRVFYPPFLFAAARLGQRRVRPALDIVLGANLVLQTAVVGAGLGAEGARILPFLVHLPFEWYALTVSVATWIVARDRIVHARELSRALTAMVVSLIIAALLETYETPHR